MPVAKGRRPADPVVAVVRDLRALTPDERKEVDRVMSVLADTEQDTQDDNSEKGGQRNPPESTDKEP